MSIENQIHHRVYYKDTDAGGVMYHSRYIELLEVGRSEYLREKGYSAKQILEQYNIIFPVISLNIDYLSPTFYDDVLLLKSTIDNSKKTNTVKVIFNYQIFNQKEKLVATAQTTHAAVNQHTLRPVRLPKEFLI